MPGKEFRIIILVVLLLNFSCQVLPSKRVNFEPCNVNKAVICHELLIKIKKKWKYPLHSCSKHICFPTFQRSLGPLKAQSRIVEMVTGPSCNHSRSSIGAAPPAAVIRLSGRQSGTGDWTCLLKWIWTVDTFFPLSIWARNRNRKKKYIFKCYFR